MYSSHKKSCGGLDRKPTGVLIEDLDVGEE